MRTRSSSTCWRRCTWCAVTRKRRSPPRRTACKARCRSAGRSSSTSKARSRYAMPLEDGGMLVHCSTQHPTEMQHVVAHALGARRAPRAGGVPAHGRRLRRQGVAVGAVRLRAPRPSRAAHSAAPVKLRPDRDDDFLITGRRHGFEYDYDVGYDDDGRVLGAEIDLTQQRRLFRRPVGAGDDARAVPRRQRLLAAARGDARLFGEDQHAEQHRVSRLRRPAGRDRDRGHPRRDRARARQGSARGAARQLLRHHRAQRHAVRPGSSTTTSSTSSSTSWSKTSDYVHRRRADRRVQRLRARCSSAASR